MRRQNGRPEGNLPSGRPFCLLPEPGAAPARREKSPEEPNQLWQMDFKGHFAMTDGGRCRPLTMSDDCSGKLLCLDVYDEEYKMERPHAAIGYDVPEKRCHTSRRRLPGAWGKPEYDVGAVLRKVNCEGYLSIQKHRYYLSESLAGKDVELRFRPENMVRVCYGAYRADKINLTERRFVSRKIYPGNL